jgi:hypothetical protein
MGDRAAAPGSALAKGGAQERSLKTFSFSWRRLTASNKVQRCYPRLAGPANAGPAEQPAEFLSAPYRGQGAGDPPYPRGESGRSGRGFRDLSAP